MGKTETHKCFECGFLTIRNRETGGIDEVKYFMRENGYEEDVYSQIHESTPLCFAMDKGHRRRQGTFDDKMFSETIHKERDCESFYEYCQGFTPKEHMEMWMREQERKYQEEQRREDKHWRIIELIVLGVIAVLVAGGFTILGAYIERGSIP